MYLLRLFIFLWFVSISNFASAQIFKQAKDSSRKVIPIIVLKQTKDSSHVKDSLKMYEDIESFSRRHIYSTFLYSLIFVPPAAANLFDSTKIVSPPKQKKTIPNTSYEGKIIRNIIIETRDPFNYSELYNKENSEISLAQVANLWHIKTQHLTIKNLLLIHKNDIYDSLLIIESERLIRRQKYVRDVSVKVFFTSQNSDSVDIIIQEIDNWSIVPRISISQSKLSYKAVDKNFWGLGHEFSNEISRYNANGNYKYNTNYVIPNIDNTFINTTLHYGTDRNRNFIKSIAVDRPFFSSVALWGAGIKFSQQYLIDSVRSPNIGFVTQKYKFNTQDYWAGYAIPIFKCRMKKNRTTSLISAARYWQINLLQTPTDSIGTRLLYTNENVYLASIGISTRKYKKDSFLFKYGVTEDVPIGSLYALTSGFQIKNNIERFYISGKISSGNYYTWGYLSATGEYGTFIRAGKYEQGMISGSLVYFTPLQELGKWKFRQFENVVKQYSY